MGKKKDRRRAQGRRKKSASRQEHRLTITGKFGSREVLSYVGPWIKGSWWLPEVDLRLRHEHGLPLTAPIDGLFLVDTGASRTCISQSVAKDLNLKARGLRDGLGSGGRHRKKYFVARCRIPANVGSLKNKWGAIEGVVEATEIPDFDDALVGLDLKIEDGWPMRPIGLVGRDFLAHSTLIYHGTRGVFEIRVNPRSMEEVNQMRLRIAQGLPPKPG